MTANEITFTRGDFGEVVPPPLVGGMTPEEAVAQLVADSQHTDSPITQVPKRGHSHQGLTNLAMLYVHQVNLARAIAGELPDDPDAAALHQLVAVDCQPLCLRPLGCEKLWLSSFVPVLQRLNTADDRWQFGLPNHGRHETFEAPLEQVINLAQNLWVAWTTDEEAQWDAWVKHVLPSVRPKYQHLVWEAELSTAEDMLVVLADDFALQRLGKHTTYRVVTPKGYRIFNAASPNRAIRIADAVLVDHQMALPSFEAGVVMAALAELGVERLWRYTADDVWQLDENIQAKQLTDDAFGIVKGGLRYGLMLKDNIFTLGPIERGKVRKLLASLTIDTNWSVEEKMNVGLMWAGWVLGGAS